TPTESRVTDLTGEGQVFGTVAYMSPEQARGAKVDARSDVFSLGVVMYQMLTGERPFQGATAVDLISSILRDRPASVAERRADLPPELAKVVRRCLEKEPRDRYQTSRDVYNELRELRAEASIAPSRAASRPEAAPPVRHDSRSARTQAFWIAVLPFTHIGGDPELASFAEALTEDIHAGLAKFPYLSVISRNSTLHFKMQTSDVRTVGRHLGARYLLEGSIRRGGSVLRVNVQLVDAPTGAHLWAETYNRDLQGSNVLAVQDDVTDRVVATVADTSGALVRSMAASVEEKPDAELTGTDVVLRHWRYQHRGTPSEHARVRDGLERFVEREPGHADAWACLARLYIHEFALGFNRRPDPLGRALRAAQRAVDLDPTCQHARAGIAQVHFFRREVPAFRAAAEQAIALNPRDTDTLGVMGNMLADSGDFERGANLVRRAMALNPHFPDWFRFALTVDCFQKADYAGALDEIARVNMPGFFWKQVWIAACAGLAGRPAEAAAAVEELRRTNPDIERQAREFMDSWLYASGLTERFLEGLAKAGLEIPAEGEPVTTAGERPRSSPPISGAARAEEGFWIAVLPFQQTGGSSELAALAEGMTDAIVAGLSRFSYLRVISRSSTRRLAGETADARAVGRQLDARYVMEGSLRQAGTRLRVAVRVVDAPSGAQVWSETYDQEFRPEAVFEIQDALAPRIVSTVADMHGVLPRSMSDALRHRPPESLSPQEAVLRSFGYWERVTPEDLAASRSALEHAVRKEPANADAWAMLGLLGVQDHAQGFGLQANALESGFEAA
ncbi:MAG TPA: protein kinase, partial [Thermoanaerobaculia bacterium]|nr:protein kinase [Thermoanaerobaculia bacterium]